VTLSGGLRILVVTPYPVWPLSHGGRVRTFRLAAGLAHAGMIVDMLCPWIPSEPWRTFRRDGVTVHPQVRVAGLLRLLARERWIPSLVTLSFEPFSLARWRGQRCADYDVVQFEFCAQARWMSKLPGTTRIVYSAHNVESDYTRAQTGRQWGLKTFARRVASLERQAVAASDIVLACTAGDADRFRELYAPRGEVVVVPNGFDGSLVDFDRRPLRALARAQFGLTEGDLALLFVGGRAPHNVDAVRFLSRDVLPKLGPRAHLLLGGDCGEAAEQGLTRQIHPLGFVGDLRPVWAAADVAVNPVAFGSGSNLKLLEYLAVGLPVVTTPFGLRGFETFQAALTVASREGFVAALTSSLRASRDVRAALAPFGWNVIGQRLGEVYRRLVRTSDLHLRGT
jgi:glycosyltransferase involved in cell wall biosynthesis